MSKIISAFAEPPALPRELLTSKSAEARHFRKNIRTYSSALAIASVLDQFVSGGPGPSKFNPNVTFRGRMYHEIGALEPATGILPRLASLYIHDTEQATSNRKQFYSILSESLLIRLALMLEENNNLVKPFFFAKHNST